MVLPLVSCWWWSMALATRVECDKESNGFGGKSDGNGDATRVGDEED